MILLTFFLSIFKIKVNIWLKLCFSYMLSRKKNEIYFKRCILEKSKDLISCNIYEINLSTDLLLVNITKFHSLLLLLLVNITKFHSLLMIDNDRHWWTFISVYRHQSITNDSRVLWVSCQHLSVTFVIFVNILIHLVIFENNL